MSGSGSGFIPPHNRAGLPSAGKATTPPPPCAPKCLVQHHGALSGLMVRDLDMLPMRKGSSPAWGTVRTELLANLFTLPFIVLFHQGLKICVLDVDVETYGQRSHVCLIRTATPSTVATSQYQSLFSHATRVEQVLSI